MGQITSFPTLDALAYIRTIVQNDSYLSGLFSYTNAVNKQTEYRIFNDPVDNRAIRGESFSAWWQGEAPYDFERRKQIPLFYLDVAAQNLDLVTAVNNSWKYMRSIIETLNLDPNLNKNVQSHWSGNIYPVDELRPNNQIWTYILRCEYHIEPKKPTLYS